MKQLYEEKYDKIDKRGNTKEEIMNKFTEKTLQTKEIFSGNIISVQVDNVLLPDGNESTREIVKHPGAVAIIAITDDDKIIFVEQYRKPLERSLIEIRAGKLAPNAQPEITALRELEEETGYTTKKLDYITSFYTSPGFADEIIHIYYTDKLKKLAYDVLGDEDEFVQLHTLNEEKIKQAFTNKSIYDAKTIYAIQYLEINNLFKN